MTKKENREKRRLASKERKEATAIERLRERLLGAKPAEASSRKFSVDLPPVLITSNQVQAICSIINGKWTKEDTEKIGKSYRTFKDRKISWKTPDSHQSEYKNGNNVTRTYSVIGILE